MEQVAQGGTVTLTAEFQTGAGDLVDPVTPRVDIIDAAEVQLVGDATPTRLSLGKYSYAYVVPTAGELGVWRAHWTGTVEGAAAGGDDWFNVVTPGAILTSAYDLLTLAEAKRAINTTAAEFDTEIQSYITAVSQRLDDLCGPIVQRSVSNEVHDGGGHVIWPRLAPVVTIGSVVEYNGAVAATLTAGTAGDFVLADAGTINSQIRSARGFVPGNANVVISYVAGRFPSTAAVAPKFKQAAAIFLSHLWRFEQGQGSATFGAADENIGIPTFGIPNAVRDLVSAELRGPAIA